MSHLLLAKQQRRLERIDAHAQHGDLVPANMQGREHGRAM